MSDFEKQLDVNKVIEWLEQKKKLGANIICDVCGANHWFIGEHIVTPVNYTKGGVSFDPRVYPFVMLTCSSCGNTKFLNAVILGLVEPSVSSEKEDAGDNHE